MEHEHPPEDERWWLDDPSNRDKVFRAVALSWVAFILAGFAPYDKHPYFAFELIPGFQGIYGLVCCIGLVLAAAWLRTVLMRDEDYYDRRE